MVTENARKEYHKALATLNEAEKMKNVWETKYKDALAVYQSKGRELFEK